MPIILADNTDVVASLVNYREVIYIGKSKI